MILVSGLTATSDRSRSVDWRLRPPEAHHVSLARNSQACIDDQALSESPKHQSSSTPGHPRYGVSLPGYHTVCPG